MSAYTTTVGIEVHVELKTKSKMFCGCANSPHAKEANTHVCPVCMAHPGTLPTVNREAVKKVRMVGIAIGGILADFSEFDRKNYFYPDIPKAYQISQYAHPLVSGGEVAGVTITRVHLEEDTARSQHEADGSSVDFNRAGVPLMELVTEPVIHSPAKAGVFARELQLLLRTLEVSDANMEKGEMRVEANISVSDTKKLGTKVEVKNLNSFKAMEAAIAYETKRHTELLKSGGLVAQETRGWDEAKNKTFSQRSKESANDYRYFPDPDIPKYQFSKLPTMNKSRLVEMLPILPTKIREKYQTIGISDAQIEILINNQPLQTFFWTLCGMFSSETRKAIVLGANYLTSDVLNLLQTTNQQLTPAAADNFLQLMLLLDKGIITSRTAKDLLADVLFKNVNPETTARARGLTQQSSREDLLPLVTRVISENNSVVTEYRAGKEAALKYLVGQGMKLSSGTANPKELETLLKENIA